MSDQLGAIDVMAVNLEQRKLIDELRAKICEHNWHLLDPLDNLETCSMCGLYRDREQEYPSESQAMRISELEAELQALREVAQAAMDTALDMGDITWINTDEADNLKAALLEK